EHRDTLWAMNSLAVTLRKEGHFAEAEKLQRQTLEIERRVLGPEAPNTLSDTIPLATTIRQESRYSEAEKLEQPTVATMRRVLGPEHPYTLTATDELAQTLGKEGRYEEAEKLARETLEIQRRVLGPDHPDAARTIGISKAKLPKESELPVPPGATPMAAHCTMALAIIAPEPSTSCPWTIAPSFCPQDTATRKSTQLTSAETGLNRLDCIVLHASFDRWHLKSRPDTFLDPQESVGDHTCRRENAGRRSRGQRTCLLLSSDQINLVS